MGRTRQLDQLSELVAAGQRLVTLFGPAGTGKTRTALALAERLRDDLDDLAEVWLCELAATRDLEGLCEVIASTLGVPPLPSSSSEQMVQRLGAAIAARGPILMVLDNFEQLVQLAGSTVAIWLAEAPELRLVVTSREHLRLRGELRFELPPLSVPAPGSANAVEDSEAVALLVDRLQALDPGFVLDAESTPLVVDLVTRLEGLPLAIELAASQVELLGLQGLLDNLHKRLDVLVGDGRDVEDRHATLRAAIDWSWSLLEPVQQQVLAQCTVFAGGFTAQAAAVVLEKATGDRPPLSVLKALRDKSMLRRDQPAERPGLPRFALFEAVREFAAERFESEQVRRRAYDRHARCYLELAERLEAQVGTPSGPDALRALALERDNLRAVHDHAMARAQEDDEALDQALRSALALDVVASIRGPVAAHLSLLEQTVSPLDGSDRPVDDRLWVRSLRARAKARLAHGQSTGALHDLEQAQARAESTGDAALLAEVLVDQGVYYHQRREIDRARALYEQALGHAKASGAQAIEGRALGNLGALVHDRHALADARARYGEALEVLRAVGDARLEAIHVCNLGVLELEHGQGDRARAHFEASVELLEPLGDRRLLAIVLGNLGTLEHMQGQLQAARQCHEDALAILREVGDRRSEALCLSRLGRAAAALGWIDDARGCLAAADRLLGRFPDPMVAATVQLDRGFVDVACARQAATEGSSDAVATHVEQARQRIAAVRAADGSEPAWTERCDDIRFAVQLMERSLDALGPAGAANHSAGSAGSAGSTGSADPVITAAGSAESPSARSEAALVIGRDGRWLQVPGGEPKDLRRRKAMRLILVRLADEHRANPGAGLPLEALLEAGWPGERVMPSAGANRVYVALTTLRKLGLRKVLLSQDDGYLIDPALPVDRRDADWDQRAAAR